MAEIERVRALFEADASQYKRTMGEMRRNTRGMENQVKQSARRSQQSLEQFSRRATAALGAVFSVVAIERFGRAMVRAIGQVDQLGKTATRINVNVEALQELRFAGERAGVAVRTMDMALQRFGRRAAEATRGTGEAQDAFKELGIQLTDSAGRMRDIDDLLMDVADAMARVEDENQLTRLGFKLFDSEGVAVVNMLREGSEALREMRQEARDLGIVLSSDLVEDAEHLQDQFTRVTRVMNSLWQQFVINVGQGLDILFDIIPDSPQDQLAEKIEELRAVQDDIRALSQAGGDLSASTGNTVSGEEMLKDLREREEQLLSETRTLHGLVEARNKLKDTASDLSAGGGLSAGGSGTSDAADEQKKKFEDLLDVIEKEISMLDAEAAVIGKSDAERRKHMATIRAEEFLRENNIELTDKQRDMLELWIEDLGRATERLKEKQQAEEGAADSAKDHTEALRGVGGEMARTILQARTLEDALTGVQNIMMRVLTQQISNTFSGIFNAVVPGLFGAASGAAFSHGRVTPFAQGGVVSSPTVFPMARGVGLMGEAGPEAVMPLSRTTGGQLGVRAEGGGTNVEVNVHAPPGSEVSQQRQSKLDKEQIDVFVDQATARNLKRPGSQSRRAMQGTFGARPTTIRR